MFIYLGGKLRTFHRKSKFELKSLCSGQKRKQIPVLAKNPQICYFETTEQIL